MADTAEITEVVAKRLPGNGKAPLSQQKADSFGVAAYDRLGCAVPPYDLDALAKAYEEDPDVYLCCNAIASKACGTGWEITGDYHEARASLKSHSQAARCGIIFPVEMSALGEERDHLHCPLGCEHPQPFCVGEMIVCGCCFYVRDRVTAMVPCSPEICGVTDRRGRK